jgi:serine/threonine protein kinase
MTAGERAPGTVFQGMTILEKLGSGGPDRLYRAEKDGQALVLAVLPADLDGTDEFAGEFLEDAGVAARIVHPNVLRVHGFGREGDELWLALEAPPGPRLMEVTRGHRCDLPHTVGVLAPIAAALDHLQAEGIVHGNLSPRWIHAGVDRVCLELGVDWILTYMCLERIQGESVGPACDVYALGLIAYELLTGRPPFGGAGSVVDEVFRKLKEAVEPPPSGSMDPATLAVLKRCLAADPRRRWPSATAFVTALAQATAVTSSG